ncbi:MAG: hypothetical protein IJI07_04460 [Flexilinea sp.]|nr:hypothetical protein [Flexilinea sp.]
MEHFEMVEKLVNTFGVNYEEAKNALEQSGWDPVEAAVILERGKNSTPETETQKVKNAARESFESCQNTVKEEGSKLFKTVWDFLSLNEFVVKKSSGEVFLNLPLWISILLLCAFFWPVVLILGVVFIMGYRFSFTGPQMGKKTVKNAMDHAEKVGEDIIEKVKNACPAEPVSTENTEIPVPETPAEPEEKTEEPSETSDSSEPTE